MHTKPVNLHPVSELPNHAKHITGEPGILMHGEGVSLHA